MSKVKASEEESYKNKPFNGEHARWEDYHQQTGRIPGELVKLFI
jgi:hypothetical protein